MCNFLFHGGRAGGKGAVESNGPVANFQGGLEGGSAGPEDLWLSSRRQVVAFLLTVFHASRGPWMVPSSLGDFMISQHLFQAAPNSCPSFIF